jgi:hypothetical protein
MMPLTVGEVSFVWSGLIEKSELRQLLDELFEDSLLTRKTDSWAYSQDLEGAYYQRNKEGQLT